MLYVLENKPEEFVQDTNPTMYKVDNVRHINKGGEICIELTTNADTTTLISNSEFKDVYMSTDNIRVGDVYGIARSDTSNNVEYWDLLERGTGDTTVNVFDDSIICPVCKSDTERHEGMVRCTNRLCGNRINRF